MVCSQMPPVYGGAGAQAALLGRELAKRGWHVSAITLDQMGVGSGCDRGIRYQRLLRGVVPTGLWTRILTTVGLGVGAFFQILFGRPAMVHIHGAYWWSILPALAGRLTGAKVIVKITRDGEDDPKSVYAKRIGTLSMGWLYGMTFKLANAVIALNQRARECAFEEGLGERTHLIFNGVDEEKFARTPLRRKTARDTQLLNTGDTVVIFVGYLVKHKGILDLLQAWRILGDRKAQLWLVGPDEGFYHRDENGTEFRVSELVESLVNDGFNITTLGHRPGDELPALYWAADVFVLPSYKEGMPNSLAEALVAGCKIVTTRIPGITDILGANARGLVAPGDVPALAQELAEAIKAETQDQSGCEDRTALVARVEMSTVADAYDDLYKRLVGSG